MLDLHKIRVIGLDLDDTLWPISPVIERAEAQLLQWLGQHAPIAAQTFSEPTSRLELRRRVLQARPELGHDMSALRHECIRVALESAGEDQAHAAPAFELFLEHRMRVDLFADALPALRFLASRFSLVSISNGNADLARVGLDAHFTACMSAQVCGVAKPDPRIFHAAAQAAGVRAHEVLHVGDDPAMDVLGAHGAGMQTVWLNRTGQRWEHDLQPHASVTDLLQLCGLLGMRDVPEI